MWFFKKKNYITFYMDDGDIKFDLSYGKGDALNFLRMMLHIFHNKTTEDNVASTLHPEINKAYLQAVKTLSPTKGRPVIEPFQSFQGKTAKIQN